MLRFAPHQLILATTLLLTLSACQGPDSPSGSVPLETDQATETMETPPTPPETETPSSETAAADKAALTFDGIDAYLIGSTTEENGLAPNTSTTGNEGCSYAKLEEYPGLLFMIVDNELARIDVQSGDWTAKDGLKIGSASDKIKASYGETVTVTPGKYDETISDYSVTDSDTRGAVFQVIDGAVSNYRIGRFPEVSWVEGCA